VFFHDNNATPRLTSGASENATSQLTYRCNEHEEYDRMRHRAGKRVVIVIRTKAAHEAR